MGQKVHPEAMRVGYIHDWKSNWFNERQFADYLHEDTRIRSHIIRRRVHHLTTHGPRIPVLIREGTPASRGEKEQ